MGDFEIGCKILITAETEKKIPLGLWEKDGGVCLFYNWGFGKRII